MATTVTEQPLTAVRDAVQEAIADPPPPPADPVEEPPKPTEQPGEDEPGSPKIGASYR